MIKIAGITRSTYYYYVNKMDLSDKYSVIRARTNDLYEEHEHRLGYRRMTLELRNEDHVINHKTVYRLMKEMGVLSRVKIKKFVL